MSNESARQAQILTALSLPSLPANQAWHAYWDSLAIPAGNFNSRMLTWINGVLGASHTNISGAMYARAAALGFARWNSANAIT